MYFALFVGVYVCLCFGMHYFVSFLVLQSLEEEERAYCFAFIFLRMSRYCKCFVALPHGAVGWSAVCDLVFPGHTHLHFVHPPNRLIVTLTNFASECNLKNIPGGSKN